MIAITKMPKIKFFRVRKNRDTIEARVIQNASNSKIVYFIMYMIFFIGFFDVFLEMYFRSVTIAILMLMLSIMLFLTERAKINQTWLALFAFGCIITVCFYLLFSDDFHYDMITSLKNTVIIAVNALRNTLLLSFFWRKKIDKVIARMVQLFFVMESAMYVLYLYFLKRGGAAERVFLENRMLRDWTNRFHGTFSEPAIMGFYLGIMFFLVLIYMNSKWKYMIAGAIVYVLYFACKAKFALIAFPIAIIVAVLTEKKFIKGLGIVFTISMVGCLFLLSLLALNNPKSIFNFIVSNFGDNASFGDRFYFLVVSLRSIIVYPFGTGYGLNYEYYYRSVHDLVPLMKRVVLDASEIITATAIGSQFGMNGKETVSHLICIYGIPGIILYLKYIGHLINLKVKHKGLIRGLIVFVFVESIVTIDIFMGYCIPLVLIVIMTINTCRIQNDEYKSYECLKTSS